MEWLGGTGKLVTCIRTFAMDLRPFGFALALSMTASAVQGQIPEGMDGGAFEPHPQAEEAISRLYSPFCPGFMLEVCTAAQSASSAAVSGRHVKMRSRLGVSPAPLALNGPAIDTECTAGCCRGWRSWLNCAW